MNNSDKYYINIRFNQRLEGLELTLVDGRLNNVFEGKTETLELNLTQGIYQLKAKFIDYSKEYTILVVKNEEFVLDFDYPSVAPILSFTTTHGYLSAPAEYASIVPTTGKPEKRPDFMFFGAKYDKNAFPEIAVEKCLKHYSIYQDDNPSPYRFSNKNSKVSNELGWFIHSRKLDEGLYFLNWNDGTEGRIFPFYIYEGYQTQFFIRYGEKPDFENSFFFYSNKKEFTVKSREYLVLDKIIYAYKDYQKYELLTEKDKAIIRQHPYLVTLIEILQIILEKDRDFKEDKKLSLPDLSFITTENGMKNEAGDVLPILSSIMCKLITFKKDEGLNFRPASLIDRTMDNLKFDIFWNNFSKIDDVLEWKDIYTNLIEKSKSYATGPGDNRIMKIGKLIANTLKTTAQVKIENRISSLLGDLNSDSNTINDALYSVDNVSKIAEKLNLPPTKVLRNYSMYNDIFKKLK